MTAVTTSVPGRDRKYPEAGNWRGFESFVWSERPDDANGFCIYDLDHRDSGLLDRSNADAVRKALSVEAFEEDVRFEHFDHWAVGWVDAVAVRVHGSDGSGHGETGAYRALCGIVDRLAEYPVLDGADYDEREYKATLENIEDAVEYGYRRVDRDRLPEGWACLMLSWFWENDDGAVENVDDQGGYPDEDQIVRCVTALWPEALKRG